MAAADSDLLEYYAEHFEPGMTDLSASWVRPKRVASGSVGGAEPGGPRLLRAAIARRYATLGEDDVVVTTGASEALAASALAILRSGDEVALANAAFPTFPSIGRALGARVRPWQESAVAKVLLLSNPSIPGGQKQDVRWWAERARAMGSRLVVDEVYRELALDGTPSPAAADIDEQAVTIGDISKPLGLPGLRIGWAATRDRALLCAIRRRVGLVTGGVAVPAAELALAAFQRFDSDLDATLDSVRLAAAATYAVLDRWGWRYEPARAGVTVEAWPPTPIADDELRSLRSHGLFLLPGRVFGHAGSFRISLAEPKAVETMLRHLSPARPRPGSIVVLTKAPMPGVAKTRLAARLGLEAAAAFASAFLHDTLALAAKAGRPVTVSMPAPAEYSQLSALAPGARLIEQPDGDLGTRIAAAFEHGIDDGPAVLIGSDTPDLPLDFLDAAFAALRSRDLVVGPALDGGFYLLGARRFDRRLLENVAWSTSSVCGQVLTNAARLGYSVETLKPWGDVDDIEGLKQLAARLSPGAAPVTAEALAAWRRGAGDVD